MFSIMDWWGILKRDDTAVIFTDLRPWSNTKIIEETLLFILNNWESCNRDEDLFDLIILDSSAERDSLELRVFLIVELITKLVHVPHYFVTAQEYLPNLLKLVNAYEEENILDKRPPNSLIIRVLRLLSFYKITGALSPRNLLRLHSTAVSPTRGARASKDKVAIWFPQMLISDALTKCN